MENAATMINVTPVQLFIAFAFQVWMIVFPIIIIKKLNILTELLRQQFGEENEENQS